MFEVVVIIIWHQLRITEKINMLANCWHVLYLCKLGAIYEILRLRSLTLMAQDDRTYEYLRIKIFFIESLTFSSS